MPNTTIYSFGDVVLVPFPFTDQSTTKKRPAVIVSSAEYNKARPDIILMAITGHLSGYARIGEVVISDWKEAGLLKTSTIKPIIATKESNRSKVGSTQTTRSFSPQGCLENDHYLTNF